MYSMKKLLTLVLMMACVVLTGCNKHLQYEEQHGRNFVKEVFSDVSGRFEDEIHTDKYTKGFLIKAHTTEGDFKLTLKDNDTGETKEVYVKGNIEEEIDITKKEARHKWTLISEYDENTEGGWTIFVRYK